jgi:rubrerythrin
VVAYGLEAGLRDFYLSMAPRIKNENARRLFEQLAAIEEKHQNRIFEEYVKVSKSGVSRTEFDESTVASAMEGGLTTEEYLNLYAPDMEKPEEIVSLAMAIEAQALDLYLRAALRAKSPETHSVLARIADEERGHLERLGKLFEDF